MGGKTFYVKGFLLHTDVLQHQIEVNDDDQSRNSKVDAASVQMSLYLREHGIKHLRCAAKHVDKSDPHYVTVLSVGEEACGRDLQAVRQMALCVPDFFLKMRDIELLSGPFVFETDRETLVLQPDSEFAYTYLPA